MEGVAPSVVKDELNANAARREQLEAQLAAAEEPPPLLHPEMARIYRTKVRELAKALQEPESRFEATEALRGLVDAIVLTPNASGDALQIELRGNLAAMLGATVPPSRAGRDGMRPRRVSPKPSAKTERWDLPLRMLSAAVLVFVLTSAAEWLGPSLSGILTPFPVATAILAGFTHAQRGSAACVEFLRPYTPGLCGFASFCMVLALTLPHLTIVASFSVALAAQLVLQTALFRRI